MLLVEKIEDINKWLLRDYGEFGDGTPNWRVVFANDMLEKRMKFQTPEGLDLLYPEVREERKYQHIIDKYVLERQVPVVGETDLITKTSFEPAWVFEDRFGNYLPPQYFACKFIIDGILEQMNKPAYYAKYKDTRGTKESQTAQVDNMEQLLFGNETPVTDALAYGSGVAGFHSKMEIEK